MIYEKGEVIPNEVIGASYFAIVKALIKCDISKQPNVVNKFKDFNLEV